MSTGDEPAEAAQLAAAHAKIAELEKSAQFDRLIGTAVGILMERHALPPDRAFSLLQQLGLRRRVKLRVIAAAIVYAGETTTPGS